MLRFGWFCLLLFLLTASACLDNGRLPSSDPETSLANQERVWWKEGVVYQIYPRSFQDSDGDGVGDLRGIIQRLDYIDSLGVDIIWLNPIYASPNDDNGYDISDYRAIMSEFGSMEDFDELLAGFHARDIRLVMDLVVNHSSDEHNWFQQARQSRDNPYRDYYHWWPAEQGEPPHRRSFFDPTGEAWRYDSLTDAYYLHYFSRKQPDLKWENPALRQAVYEMMRFWFEKGVDGFRMDVIPFISKDTTWPEVTEQELIARYHDDIWARYYADGPQLHAYLREMNEEALRDYDVMALGEGAGVTIDQATKFVAEERQELDLFFHFDGMALGYSPRGYRTLKPEGWSLPEFKRVYTRWDSVFAQKGWGSIYLGNHDQPRMVSRWGNDRPALRAPSAKLLHTFILSMRGTSFIYYGDEIGMANLRLDDIEDYRDIQTRNWYQLLRDQGEDLAPYMEDWKVTARDNGRSPMQWSDAPQAGFTTAEPWLQLNDDYPEVNVAAQKRDSASVLRYFQRMVQLRHAHPVLVYGDYEVIQPEHPQIYAYWRRLPEREVMVLLNFSQQSASLSLAAQPAFGPALINNYPTLERGKETITLQPYQAVILPLTDDGRADK